MLPSSAGDDPTTRLALAAKAGDRAAATAFIEATQRDVRNFLTHLVGRGEAEDLAQETYLRAMRALRGYAARASARTWLLSIARRVAVDHLRAAARGPRLDGGAEWQTVAEASELRRHGSRLDERVALMALLDGLGAERREAFVATQVLGLSYAEAAQVCGCPVGTIRSRVARAREDLVAAVRDPGRGRGSAAAG
jgi:RNA polymerase sigma-70 factor (ECF subfamily)